MPKCDCGYQFKESDICHVDMAGDDYYPYEGEIYTFLCDKCSYTTELTATDIGDDLNPIIDTDQIQAEKLNQCLKMSDKKNDSEILEV